MLHSESSPTVKLCPHCTQLGPNDKSAAGVLRQGGSQDTRALLDCLKDIAMNSNLEALTPNVMVFVGGSLMNAISAPMKSAPESCLVLSLILRQGRMQLSASQEESLPDPGSASTWSWISSLQAVRN